MHAHQGGVGQTHVGRVAALARSGIGGSTVTAVQCEVRPARFIGGQRHRDLGETVDSLAREQPGLCWPFGWVLVSYTVTTTSSVPSFAMVTSTPFNPPTAAALTRSNGRQHNTNPLWIMCMVLLLSSDRRHHRARRGELPPAQPGTSGGTTPTRAVAAGQQKSPETAPGAGNYIARRPSGRCRMRAHPSSHR